MPNMKEEQEIIRKCGKGTPFKVPEGYFEDFTRNLMAQLPEKGSLEEEQPEPRITPWQRIKPLLYMAAMFIGMIVCVRAVLGEHSNNTADQTGINFAALEYLLNEEGQLSDEELATLVDYTMMDNYTLYQYLTEVD